MTRIELASADDAHISRSEVEMEYQLGISKNVQVDSTFAGQRQSASSLRQKEYDMYFGLGLARAEAAGSAEARHRQLVQLA